MNVPVSMRRLVERRRTYRQPAINWPVDRWSDALPAQAEARGLKSQTVTSNRGGRRRSRPRAFTEQGVAMLSSVLRSPRAVAVNIQIMRAFVELRRLAGANADVIRRLDDS